MMDFDHLQKIMDLAALLPDSSPEEKTLSAHGWIPLGKEAFTGEPGWTTLERGLLGAVSQSKALRIVLGIAVKEVQCPTA